jgi:SAM-dependent methyltransferase
VAIAWTGGDHAVMEAAEYSRLFELESRHFWYAGLHALLRGALARAGGSRVLDAGCGTGGLLASLPGATGVDRSPLALSFCERRGLRRIACADVARLPFADGAFDAVVSADVLYHRAVADDGAALAELGRVTRPGGAVILNLPAHRALRGAHDEFVHGARRYARADVARLAARAGLSVERLTSWNCALLPAAWLARRLSRGSLPRSDVALPPAPLNAALSAWLRAEAALALRTGLPWGLSVFAVLRRPAPAGC